MNTFMNIKFTLFRKLSFEILQRLLSMWRERNLRQRHQVLQLRLQRRRQMAQR